MGKRMVNKKIVSLPVEQSLYDLLKEYAECRGEGVTDLVSRMLADSMDSWCDYCDSLRLMENEENNQRICVIDKA